MTGEYLFSGKYLRKFLLHGDVLGITIKIVHEKHYDIISSVWDYS